jgi:hypothetical protein
MQARSVGAEFETYRSDRHNLSITKAQLGRVSSRSSKLSIRCLVGIVLLRINVHGCKCGDSGGRPSPHVRFLHGLGRLPFVKFVEAILVLADKKIEL